MPSADPPSTPAPRERLLAAAADLFCRFGFHAVGVDAIIEAAGTAKTTLYKLFGSKDALVEAVLEREGIAWRDWFIGSLDAGAATSRERLARIAPLLREWFGSERFYGCPFINAVGEHDKGDDRMRRIAMSHKRAVLDRIERLVAEAGAADANGLAHQIGLVVDGAIVAALVSRDPMVVDIAGRTLTCVLDAGLAPPVRQAARRAKKIAA